MFRFIFNLLLLGVLGLLAVFLGPYLLDRDRLDDRMGLSSRPRGRPTP